MAEAKQKVRIKDKNVRIFCCVLIYAVLFFFILGLFLFNADYQKIYKSPEVHGGKADFENIDIPSRDVACNLAGEWEFFYNKWIITDDENCSPDGLIKLPDVWMYKDFGNGRLSKSGYASYRLYVENVQSDINLIVYRNYSNLAFRVFINGELNYRSGILSKNISETKVTGQTDERYPYRTDGSPIEIVVEVSAMNIGGFNTVPWLAATDTGVSYGNKLRSFNYIAIGLTSAAVIASILMFVFFSIKRDITIPLFLVSLDLHFLASKDMMYVFRFLSSGVSMLISLFSAIASFVFLALHFYRNKAPLKRKFVIPTSILSAVFVILTIVFYGTFLSWVFAFLLFAVGLAYLVPVIFNKNFTMLQYCVYGVLFVFLMSLFFFEMTDWLGLLVFGTEFVFTFESVIIIACFVVLWLWKLAKTVRIAVRANELDSELSILKNQALKAQIKPHFIYNSLTAIQAQYRESLCSGDKAIEKFASHLRLITDSKGDDFIPFEDEVRNVMNYFELENMRANGELNLLLDLNYSDFTVPVLSLQPLVENAIRHAGLTGREDSYILISSEKQEFSILISVYDNGKGFDLNTIQRGVGLENTEKRFSLMNAKMTVESSPDAGTKITIEIPLEKEYENHCS